MYVIEADTAMDWSVALSLTSTWTSAGLIQTSTSVVVPVRVTVSVEVKYEVAEVVNSKSPVPGVVQTVGTPEVTVRVVLYDRVAENTPMVAVAVTGCLVKQSTTLTLTSQFSRAEHCPASEQVNPVGQVPQVLWGQSPKLVPSA